MERIFAVATDQRAGRVGLDPIRRLFRIENHDEAYHRWRETGVKNRVLVHVDAHHDMWWAEDRALLDITNFVCLALRENLVREVHWVVPDGSWDSGHDRRHVVRHFRQLTKEYPGSHGRPEVWKDRIVGTLLGKPMRICSLASLVVPEEPVLLDVDVDFLLFRRVNYGLSDAHEALPWCWPEELVTRLRARHVLSDFITIAYSVEGGYTPLEWKYLGDELSLRLAQPDSEDPSLVAMLRMREAASTALRGELAVARQAYEQAMEILPASAAPVWRLARLHLDLQDDREARRLYHKALSLDPSYRTIFRNAGFWHGWNKRFDAAEHEHRRTLRLDPEDAYAHLGLGWLALRAKHWQEAEVLLQKARQLDNQLVDAHRALGEALTRQKRDSEAIAAYEASLKLALAGRKPLRAPIATFAGARRIADPGHGRAYRELARLYERRGAPDKAIRDYLMSTAAGPDSVFLRARLARLYLKERDWPAAAREGWKAVRLIPGALDRIARQIFGLP